MKPSIVIIEDHPLYRDALINLIQSELPDHRVLGESNVSLGMKLIDEENELTSSPTIILLDLALPELAGIAAVYQLASAYPDNPLCIVSATDDYMQISSCIHAGAKLFISKTAPPHLLIAALKKIIDGTKMQTNWIAADGERTVDTRHAIKLTQRQIDVLSLICQGKSNREIAAQLAVAEITAKAHVSAIFRELKVVNRTQALLAAQRLGLATTTETTA
jgi:DNA-binding NarL/FixJ family response regulator